MPRAAWADATVTDEAGLKRELAAGGVVTLGDDITLSGKKYACHGYDGHD